MYLKVGIRRRKIWDKLVQASKCLKITLVREEESKRLIPNVNSVTQVSLLQRTTMITNVSLFISTYVF